MTKQSSAAEPPLTLGDPQVQACPFPTYDRMRAKSPVYFDPVTGMYVVTAFDLVRQVAANPALYSNDTRQLLDRDTPAAAEIRKLLQEADFLPVNTLVTNDPPSHRRYRSLVDKAFNIARVEAAEPRIIDIAGQLIDALGDGPTDFVQAFAIPLPMRMIAELLGVPPEMSDTFKRWSDATLESADFNIPPERQIACVKAQIEMFQFFWMRAEELRQAPQNTLISDLANTRLEGELLNRHELTSILLQLLVAGNETTTNALTWCADHLASSPQLQAELRARPEHIPAFTEEVLRLQAPLQGLFRRVLQPVELGGVALPEGAILNLRWGAANRDACEFAQPEVLDLGRSNITQHLTFGFGVHYCLGNRLARAELQQGVRLLLERTASIELAGSADARRQTGHFIAHGLSRLMLKLTPAG
jgi:cytochrome P450